MPAPERIRLDKWLVQARFFKTRALATALVESGRIRLNGQHVAKSAQAVGAGDTLTFPQGAHPRDPGSGGGAAPRSCHRSPHAL